MTLNDVLTIANTLLLIVVILMGFTFHLKALRRFNDWKTRLEERLSSTEKEVARLTTLSIQSRPIP